MTEKSEKQLAADRKAAALRANLKRRKAAARKDAASADGSGRADLQSDQAPKPDK